MIDWQYMQGDPPLSEHQAELVEIDAVWNDAGFTVVPVRDWHGRPIPASEIHGVSTDAMWARYRGRGGAGDVTPEAVELLVRLWPLFGEAFVSTMVHDAWQAARGPLKVALRALLHHRVEKITVDVADDDADSSRDDLFEFLADDAPDVDRQVDALVDIALN